MARFLFSLVGKSLKTMVTGVGLLSVAAGSYADIYQWEFVNPADPSQGKQASTTLVPSGAGAVAQPGVQLPGANLTKAFLPDVNLSLSNLRAANLSEAFLSGSKLVGANLLNARFQNADLTGANISGSDLKGAFFQGANLADADIRGASFEFLTDRGFTASQLYATGSYQNRDLSGINVIRSDFSGWDFSEQNLTGAVIEATLQNANFRGANLTNATIGGHWGGGLSGVDFTDASIQGAKFGWQNNPQLTFGQFQSTASYRSGNVRGVSLSYHDLTGWDLAGLDLTDAKLGDSQLAEVNFANAIVRGVDFTSAGITELQLRSTASFQLGQLQGVSFRRNNLSHWDLSSLDLSGANFIGCTLTGVDFTDSLIEGAQFSSSAAIGISALQLYSTASYSQKKLTGITLSLSSEEPLDLSGQDLTNADLGVNWDHVDLQGAIIRGLRIGYRRDNVPAAGTIYATQSYQQGDLRELTFEGLGGALDGWDLSNQDLSGSVFRGHFEVDYLRMSNMNLRNANLMNVQMDAASFNQPNLDGADTRGSTLIVLGSVASQDRVSGINTILPQGDVEGVDLTNEGIFIVRNYVDPTTPIPIRIHDRFVADSTGRMEVVLDDAIWNSTISFDAAILVQLGGTLSLQFADGVQVGQLVGRSYQLFDWSNVSPVGQFLIESPHEWDVSRLYSDGTVRLVTAIPEPSAIQLVIALAIAFGAGVLKSRW